jgi:hypothetical protein
MDRKPSALLLAVFILPLVLQAVLTGLFLHLDLGPSLRGKGELDRLPRWKRLTTMPARFSRIPHRAGRILPCAPSAIPRPEGAAGQPVHEEGALDRLLRRKHQGAWRVAEATWLNPDER